MQHVQGFPVRQTYIGCNIAEARFLATLAHRHLLSWISCTIRAASWPALSYPWSSRPQMLSRSRRSGLLSLCHQARCACYFAGRPVPELYPSHVRMRAAPFRFLLSPALWTHPAFITHSGAMGPRLMHGLVQNKWPIMHGLLHSWPMADG